MNRLIFVFFILLLSNISLASDKQKIIVYDSGDLISESFRPAFPETIEFSEKLISNKYILEAKKKLINYDFLDFKDNRENSINEKPKKQIINISKIIRSIVFIFSVILSISFLLKLYHAVHAIVTEKENASNSLKISFIELFISLFFLTLLLPSLDGMPLFFVALVASCVAGLEFASLIIISMFSYSIFDIKDINENAYKYIDLTDSYKTTVAEIAQGKILEDALLDTSFKLNQRQTESKNATNQAVFLVGQAQIDFEKQIYGTSISRPDCLLLNNWFQNGFFDKSCTWIHQEETGYGLINSELKLERSKKNDISKLTPQNAYISSQVSKLIDNEVWKYVEHQKTVICPSIHGFTSQEEILGDSLFCAKRNRDNSIIDGEYYGYNRIDSFNFRAVDLDSVEYDWSSFTDEVKVVINNLVMYFLKKEVLTEVAVYDKGFISLPYQFVKAISRINSSNLSLFKRAVKHVNIGNKKVLNYIKSGNTLKPEKLVNISSDEAVYAYLKKHFPYAAESWFKETSFIAEKTINQIGYDNGNTFVDFYNFKNISSEIALIVYGAYVGIDILSLAKPFGLEFISKLFIYVSVFVNFAVLIALSWFPVMVTFKYVIWRQLLVLFAFPLLFIKKTVDDLMSLDSSSEIDVISMKDLSLIVINTFLYLVFAGIVYSTAFLTTDFIVPFVFSILFDNLVVEGTFLGMSLVIFNIAEPFARCLLILFIMYRGCIRLFNALSSTLNDSAFTKIEENLSSKLLANKINIQGMLFKK